MNQYPCLIISVKFQATEGMHNDLWTPLKTLQMAGFLSVGCDQKLLLWPKHTPITSSHASLSLTHFGTVTVVYVSDPIIYKSTVWTNVSNNVHSVILGEMYHRFTKEHPCVDCLMSMLKRRVGTLSCGKESAHVCIQQLNVLISITLLESQAESMDESISRTIRLQSLILDGTHYSQWAAKCHMPP